jgi:hypothetical protein
MMKKSSVSPPAWHASRLSSNHTLGLVSSSHLGTLVEAWKREGTSHPVSSGRKLAGPSGLETSCGHSRRRYHSVTRVLSLRTGVRGSHHGDHGCRGRGGCRL